MRSSPWLVFNLAIRAVAVACLVVIAITSDSLWARALCSVAGVLAALMLGSIFAGLALSCRDQDAG